MNHDQRYQATRNRNPFSCLQVLRWGRRRGGALNEYQWPPDLVWSGLSVVSVPLPLPGPTAVFSLSSCSEG